MVRNVEMREIRNERTIIMFNVTDFTDTITVKVFAKMSRYRSFHVLSRRVIS